MPDLCEGDGRRQLESFNVAQLIFSYCAQRHLWCAKNKGRKGRGGGIEGGGGGELGRGGGIEGGEGGELGRGEGIEGGGEGD